MANKILNYKELLKINEGGVFAANFPQIRIALENAFKGIYGNDIDLDIHTADGQYIHQVALILNNLYNLIYLFGLNLIPSSASHNYLEVLLRLKNIIKEESSHSTAYCIVKPSITANNIKSLTAIDKFDNEWEWTSVNKDGDNLEANKYYILQFTCKTEGQITSVADEITYSMYNKVNLNANNHGGIYRITKASDENPLNFSIWQKEDAKVGLLGDTDVTLKNKNMLSGTLNNSTNVIFKLKGALEAINGISECKLYFNNNSTNITAADETPVQQGYVYICLRYEDNFEIPDSLIGKTIYENLPLGLLMQQTTGANNYGVAKSYAVAVLSNNITQTSYWKKCTPYTNVNLTLELIQNPSTYSQELSEPKIREAIMRTVRETSITEPLFVSNIIGAVNSADTFVNNEYTFICTDGNFGSAGLMLENRDTYFSYDDTLIYFLYETGGDKVTVKCRGKISGGNPVLLIISINQDTGVISTIDGSQNCSYSKGELIGNPMVADFQLGYDPNDKKYYLEEKLSSTFDIYILNDGTEVNSSEISTSQLETVVGVIILDGTISS